MHRFQRLLVGIDLTIEGDAVSPGSLRAALQAKWLAERTGAQLTFLHSTWADLYEDRHIIRQGPGPEGRAALEALLEEYRASQVATELVFGEDRPWIEIIRRVQRKQNDIVFVARRNAPGVKALGSVSRKLMRKCPAPVWVVKPDTDLTPDCVLAATDLTPVGDLAVELADFIAHGVDCDLHVVHAFQIPLELQLAPVTRSEQEHAQDMAVLRDKAVQHILEALRSVRSEADADLHVGCDAPSLAILEGIEKLNVDLLVMGTVSRGGIAGFLMGNTAERLLDQVECSLLTIKPADFISPVSAD